MVLTDELIGVKNFLAKVAEKKGKAPAKEKIKVTDGLTIGTCKETVTAGNQGTIGSKCL